MRQALTVLILTTALLSLGCGQMGPLYEPEVGTPVTEPPSQESGIKP
ncbi:MAG: hypothetical protein AAGI44_14695 [Pseudomonadota bacterium]